MNIAIVGATGNVGRKILEVLEKKGLSIDNLYLLASSKSAGSKINFLGKEKLKKVKLDGIKKKLMGVKLDAKEISMSGSLDLKDDNDNIIGELRSACYSPHFGKVIGIAMMKKPNWEVSQSVKAEITGNICSGNVCDLPFI